MTATLTYDERRVRLQAEQDMLHEEAKRGHRNVVCGVLVFAGLALFTVAWLLWFAHQPLAYMLPMIPVSAVGVMFIFTGSQGRSFARLQRHINSAHLEYLHELAQVQQELAETKAQVYNLEQQQLRDREEAARRDAETKRRLDLLEARLTHPRTRKWARYGWTAPRQATAPAADDEAAYLVDMSEMIRIGRELERRQIRRQRGEAV